MSTRELIERSVATWEARDWDFWPAVYDPAAGREHLMERW